MKYFTLINLRWLLLLTLCVLGHHNINAQVYATPELKAAEEKHIAEKNARLGIVPETTTEVLPTESNTPAQPLPDLTGFYKISSIEAVNFAPNHTKAEIEKFKAEAKSEFELNTFYLSFERSELIKMRRASGRYQVFKINIALNEIKIDCKECNTPPFIILENTPTKVVFLEPSQDEGQVFDFKFTFIK